MKNSARGELVEPCELRVSVVNTSSQNHFYTITNDEHNTVLNHCTREYWSVKQHGQRERRRFYPRLSPTNFWLGRLAKNAICRSLLLALRGE
jgi:hypothetical protein